MARSKSIYSGPLQKDTPPGAVAGMDEIKLWNDFRNGDKSAFAALYVKFFPVLYAYGCRICKDHDLVQDCIQDLFLDLCRQRTNLSATNSIRYYLYRCIRRKISVKASMLNSRRTERFDDHHYSEFEDIVILPLEFQQIEMEMATEQRLEILRALQCLTTNQRQAVKLRFYENISCKEISAVMSVHIHTVYNLLSLATTSLRNILRRSVLLALAFHELFP